MQKIGVFISVLFICAVLSKPVSKFLNAPDATLHIRPVSPNIWLKSRDLSSPSSSFGKKVPTKMLLFDAGFLQLVKNEFTDKCYDNEFPCKTTNVTKLHRQRMQIVLDYRKSRFLRGFDKITSGCRLISQKIHETRHFLIAGAIGRCVAVSIMFPIDTIKTRLQMFGSACCTRSQWSDALRLPVYNGVSSSLVGQVPNGMLVYGSYELYKKEISERFPNLDIAQVRFISAMLGDVTGSAWIVPFESTKQRVQAGVFPTVRAGLAAVLRSEGIPGLYRGYPAQLLRDVTYHAVQLPLYETAARLCAARRPSGEGGGKRRALTAWESMACGAVAGAASGAVTTPLDVIKTRLMTAGPGASPGLVRTVRGLWTTEGVRGFTAGMAQRSAYIAAGSAIFFAVFEQAHRGLMRLDPLTASSTSISH